MADSTNVSLKPIPVPPTSYNPLSDADYPPGTPVCSKGSVAGEVTAAQSGITATAFAVGLVGVFGARTGLRNDVQFSGILSLTADEWDALVTGSSGGLTEGALYYVQDDSEAPGRLTKTNPDVQGTFIGIALSPLTMMIQLQAQLSSGGGGVTGQTSMFYGLTAGTGNGGTTDYASTVAVGAPVPFPRNGPTAGTAVVRAGGSSPTAFEAVNTGIYQVSWAIDTLEENQFQLAIVTSGPTYTPIANTTATSGAGTQGNSNTVLVSLTAGQEIALINPAGNAAALTVQTADGSITHAQAPSLIITQVA